MTTLFDDPMVQAGFAPLLVALLLAAAAALLAPPRLATLPGLAVVAAWLTTVLLTTGLSFTPLSASRKVLLLGLAAPLLGLALDLAGLQGRRVGAALALALAAASVWVFQSVWAQAEGAAALLPAAGVVLFVAVLAALVLSLRDDAVASASATLGLGLAVAVTAVLSASIGTLMNGMAVATGGGALLLLGLLRGRMPALGWAGTLTTAAAASLMAAATFTLAELRAPVLPLLAAVPLVAGLKLFPDRSPRQRLVLRGALTTATALLPIAAAWWLARGATPA